MHSIDIFFYFTIAVLVFVLLLSIYQLYVFMFRCQPNERRHRAEATQMNVDRVDVIKSNKGHFKIIYKGFMYTKHKSFNNVTRWRCAARGCCKGSIMTSNDFTRPTPKMSHTHPPDYRACELAKARYLIPQVNTVVLKKENLQGNETPDTYTSPKIENVPAITRSTPMVGGVRFIPGEYQSNDVILVNDPSTHFMDLLWWQ